MKNLKEEFDRLQKEIEDLKNGRTYIYGAIEMTKHSVLLSKLAQVKSKMVEATQLEHIEVSEKDAKEAVERFRKRDKKTLTQEEVFGVEERKQVDFNLAKITIENALTKYARQYSKNEEVENAMLFIELLTKSSKFAHKAHIELKKRM